jgi:hypothetical protein
MLSVACGVIITVAMVYVGVPLMGYAYLVLRVVMSKQSELAIRQQSSSS